MNHRNFMRSLTKAERHALTQKTNDSGLIRLTLLIILIICTSTLIVTRVTFWPILLLPHGLLLISLFHLLHECIHDTPFSTQWLNKITAAICGSVLFLPSEWFRYFHRDHHRYTQVKGKDPELATEKPATSIEWVAHVSGLPVYKSLAVVIFKHAIGTGKDTFVPTGAHAEVVMQIRHMVTLYLLLFISSVIFTSTLLLWLWIIPLLLGQPFLRLYLLAEHGMCEYNNNMLLNTRTVLTNPVVRWFTWNMPYHTEHHVYPGVPFHHLPQLHDKMKVYLANTSSGYAEFNREMLHSLHGPD